MVIIGKTHRKIFSAKTAARLVGENCRLRHFPADEEHFTWQRLNCHLKKNAIRTKLAGWRCVEALTEP
jgi:hypothetical protein